MTIPTVTTETITGVADLKVGYTLGNADVAILKALAAELLAVREAQSVPVAWQQRFSGDHWQSCSKSMFDYLSENPDPIVEVREVYAVPPAPAVPDAVDYSDLDATSRDREVIEAIAECKGWNACRAAMLQPVRQGCKMPKTRSRDGSTIDCSSEQIPAAPTPTK